MYTPQNFRDEVIGKKFDIDGYYGAQCWDGYAYYMKKLGYAYANCITSGYVKDIWNNRANNGMLDSCEIVSVMQQGDIAVFGETSESPFSHIAIFMKDNGNETGIFLGQNQGGLEGAFNEKSLSYSGILGAYRPKCFKNLFTQTNTDATDEAIVNFIPSDFRHEVATFTVQADAPIKIRRAPSIKGKDTGYQYINGNTVVFDGYVVREGYVWISWISHNDNTRRWMACGRSNEKGINIEPWGIFK